MQAIQTKYFGPGARGARIKAVAQATSGGGLYFNYDHALNLEQNHRKAAEKLANRYEWLDGGDTLHGGQLEDGTFAWVIVEPKVVATNDWRDTAVDALIEGKIDYAQRIIEEQLGEDQITPEQLRAFGEWEYVGGRTFYLNDEPAFSITWTNDNQRPRKADGKTMSPAELDAITLAVAGLLRSK